MSNKVAQPAPSPGQAAKGTVESPGSSLGNVLAVRRTKVSKHPVLMQGCVAPKPKVP